MLVKAAWYDDGDKTQILSYQMSKNNYALKVYGPKTAIPIATEFTVTISNLLAPAIPNAEKAEFSVALYDIVTTDDYKLLEISTAQLTRAETPAAIPVRGNTVNIIKASIDNNQYGAMAKYVIEFKLLPPEKLFIDEMILDLSAYYYPYSLSAYPGITCGLTKVTALDIPIVCAIYGRSAIRVVPGGGTENFELKIDILYQLTVSSLQNPYKWVA